MKFPEIIKIFNKNAIQIQIISDNSTVHYAYFFNTYKSLKLTPSGDFLMRRESIGEQKLLNRQEQKRFFDQHIVELFVQILLHQEQR